MNRFAVKVFVGFHPLMQVMDVNISKIHPPSGGGQKPETQKPEAQQLTVLRGRRSECR
jgi:hypothetical protein